MDEVARSVQLLTDQRHLSLQVSHEHQVGAVYGGCRVLRAEGVVLYEDMYVGL